MKYSTINKQYPIRITDVINDDYIVVKIKGKVDLIDDSKYGRHVNEAYKFDDIDICISFLNNDSKKSLFPILFNGQLGKKSWVKNYERYEHHKIFDLHNKTDHKGFHCEEELSFEIRADGENIDKLDKLLNVNLCETHKWKKNDIIICENLDKYNKIKTKYCEIDKFNLCDARDFIPSFKGICVYFRGKTNCCHETMSYYHNEFYLFKNMATLKEFMECDARLDEFWNILSEGCTITEIKRKKNKIILKVDNDFDQWTDELKIVFYGEHLDEIEEYLEEFQ